MLNIIKLKALNFLKGVLKWINKF